ncbi:hypothetical protein CDD83_7584 [Cordyceps sp. RAO-2017]|nr:hypothetical protein CDD83_7584 [Cordyceps sp. RAO-2017]
MSGIPTDICRPADADLPFAAVLDALDMEAPSQRERRRVKAGRDQAGCFVRGSIRLPPVTASPRRFEIGVIVTPEQADANCRGYWMHNSRRPPSSPLLGRFIPPLATSVEAVPWASADAALSPSNGFTPRFRERHVLLVSCGSLASVPDKHQFCLSREPSSAHPSTNIAGKSRDGQSAACEPN